MQRLARTAFVLALCVILPLRLSAQIGTQDAADLKEIAAYKLSMETVHKFENAIQFYVEEAKKDPKVQAQMKLKAQVEELKKKDELTDDEQTKLEKLEQELEEAQSKENAEAKNANTLSEMADVAAKNPMLNNALRRAGLTPREYAVFTMALFQSMMFSQLKKSGNLNAVPKELKMNSANVTFVEEHEAELMAMSERMKKENPQDR